MENEFKAIINRSVLNYAVGRAIVCPACDTILDARHAVLATDGDRATVVLCTSCWPNGPATFTAGSVEVIDGRTLYTATLARGGRRYRPNRQARGRSAGRAARRAAKQERA